MRRSRITVALSAAWGALVLSRPISENDFFWHLTLGREVARAGSRVVTEPVAFTWGVPRTLAVPEWLWDVLAWRAFDASETAAAVFISLCGALAAGALAAFVVSEVKSRALAPAVTALVLCVASVRFKERPETVALAFAALFLLGSRRLVTRFSWPLAGALLALEVLWAQTHGTFVLALPFFIACAVDAKAEVRAKLVGVAGALALGLFTGPAGVGVLSFVSSHVAGDAVRHIIDMSAPTWSDFSPASQPYHFLAALLTLAALPGLFADRWTWSSLALFALGLALAVTAVRGVSWWALCLVPQLALTWRDARPLRDVTVLAFSLACALWVTVRFEQRVGPFFAFEVRASELPREAAQVLATLPAGAVVWTGYEAGAALGFLGEGKLRVSIDSRTPLFFGDSEFALSRDCRANMACLRRALDAMHADAAFVERGDACDAILKLGDFVPVAVNARYATFARASTQLAPLKTLDVCAPMLVTERSCADDFTADAQRLEPAGAFFMNFLTQARDVRCGKQGDLPLLTSMLRANPRWPALRVLAGTSALRTGDAETALESLWPALRTGFPPALGPSLGALKKLAPDARARWLTLMSAELDDATPALLRVLRAETAAELNDAETARFEALRAASAGEVSVVPVLRALRTATQDPAERAELDAWLRVLAP